MVQEFVRQVEEPCHVVVFTDSDHVGCLKHTSSSKLFYGSHMQRSTSTAQGVIALGSGEPEFFALVKGTSAGLGAVSVLIGLGVDISKNTKIDKAVRREDSSHCCSDIVGTEAQARRHSQNLWNLSQTWQILEPNTLAEGSIRRALRDVTATFV